MIGYMQRVHALALYTQAGPVGPLSGLKIRQQQQQAILNVIKYMKRGSVGGGGGRRRGGEGRGEGEGGGGGGGGRDSKEMHSMFSQNLMIK